MAAMFTSRLLPARVELPECDICTEPLECSEAAGGEAKESRLPRLLLPCGHSYCTRCIQMGLEANGGLLKCPDRCVIDPPQQPVSALKLPKNFALMKTIESQADLAAMAELSALPCQQCNPSQAGQPAKVHCGDCGADYCKQHDAEAHVAAQLASHHRISIVAYAAQLSAAAITKKGAAFAAAAAASRAIAHQEECKASEAIQNAKKRKRELEATRDLDSVEGMVESTAKELIETADRLRSDFVKHRQTVTAASQQLTDRAADLESLSRSAQLVQHASDFDANRQVAQLQSDSQRVHAQMEHAAQESGRSFSFDVLLELQPSLSLSHAIRHSQILNADLIVKLAPFLRGLTIKAQLELLYRATRDGFARRLPALLCLHGADANAGEGRLQPLRLSQVSDNGFVFGAYTHCSWPSGEEEEETVADPTGLSFLFSLLNATGKTARFSLRDKDRAIQVGDFIYFGAPECDGGRVGSYSSVVLMLKGAADQPDANCANHPTLHHTPYQPDDAALLCDTTFFAGQQDFAAVEIEVFQL